MPELGTPSSSDISDYGPDTKKTTSNSLDALEADTKARIKGGANPKEYQPSFDYIKEQRKRLK